jgi:hypothetical protein
MLLLDDLLEVADVDLHVLGGGADWAVAKDSDSLDVGDVGASPEQMRRTGMPQRVGVRILRTANGRLS